MDYIKATKENLETPKAYQRVGGSSMASRVLHLAVAEELMKVFPIKDKNRFLLGSILPDAYQQVPKSDSHFKISVCGKSKRTYDLDGYRARFADKMGDELYLGYYLHLIQDLVFRELVYKEYNWNPLIPGNVERLHRDYQLINSYVIRKYGVEHEIHMVSDLHAGEVQTFLEEMKEDFRVEIKGEAYFFTEAMADEFVAAAAEVCKKELQALKEGGHYVDAYERAWKNKPVSLLRTTQNTRELGGYRTRSGAFTREDVLIRSDVPNYPDESDLEFLKLHGITTIIDLRGEKDILRKPSGFAEKEGFQYYNFQIEEGSGVPESVSAVPESYMKIASAKAMPEVFRCIADTKTGVMFHCTAGKDRTGVVSAILLLHAGVSDKDIIENYLLTREYGKERLELVHRNFPEIDMNIVTPCEMFMKEFLRLFRETYADTDNYFRKMGLDTDELQRIRNRLVRD